MISPDTAYFLSVLIMMTVAGLAVGNYATSIIYRLPRGLKIPNDPPYCDSCEKYLEVRDLYPFISWVINHGKCRFCKTKIPSLYAVAELSSAILFVTATLHFGIGEKLILVLALGVFLMILSAIYWQNNRLFNEILIAVASIAAVMRVLEDGSIFPFLQGGYWGMMIGVTLWLLHRLIKRGTKVPFPSYVIMIIMGGWCLSTTGILSFFLLTIIMHIPIYLLLSKSDNKKASPFSASWIISSSLSILLTLYYPNLIKNLLQIIPFN